MENDLIPQRGSLLAECVRVMRLRIEAGEWSRFLPGERRLAELLHVGRDTVRLTLAELEHDGWLEPAKAGRRRQVVKLGTRPTIRSTKHLRVGMLSPQRLERQNLTMLLEVDKIRHIVAEKGGSFELYSPGWYESQQPDARLSELIDAERRTVWILHRSTPQVQKWFESNRLPCLVRGTPSEGISLPFLDVDWKATARHAAGMLWRLGHRRIGILTPLDRLVGVNAAIDGAQQITEDGFKVVVMQENGTAGGVERIFTRTMGLLDPPTALIATRARQVITLFGCAARRGMRVPEDLSLVSLVREPYLEYMIPEVTGYLSKPTVLAKQVVRRLEQLAVGNITPAGNPWLVPEAAKGASVAPPPLK